MPEKASKGVSTGVAGLRRLPEKSRGAREEGARSVLRYSAPSQRAHEICISIRVRAVCFVWTAGMLYMQCSIQRARQARRSGGRGGRPGGYREGVVLTLF